MIKPLARAVIYGVLILEAVKAALWIAHLLPSLGVRDRTTIVLVVARAGVSSLQIVGGLLLRAKQMSGPTIARWAVIASAVLVLFEVGLRLVPSSLDPTYRWWFVVAYWMYAVAVGMVVGRLE